MRVSYGFPLRSGKEGSGATRIERPRTRFLGKRTMRWRYIGPAIAIFAFVALGTATTHLVRTAFGIKAELSAVEALLPKLKSELLTQDVESAEVTLAQIADHADAAAVSGSDGFWRMAGSLPFVGSNFTAVSEIALSVKDLVYGTAKPLLGTYGAFDWAMLAPINGKVDASLLREAAPALDAASNTVDLTYARLENIEQSSLLPQVSEPLVRALAALSNLSHPLQLAADVSGILPAMLGADEPRNYLLMIQNNAEVRATGGLPGALAVLRVNNGTIDFTEQASGSSLGKFVPPVPVDRTQSSIYTTRLGSYISDVNLTPDFPTVSKTAKEMWQQRHGTPIDGVIALDSFALSHLLDATGPIRLSATTLAEAPTLTSTLNSANVVQTLLSDSYSSISDLGAQDRYFSGVARDTFMALSRGGVDGEKLVHALVQAAIDDRIFVWSRDKDEQDVLATTGLGGAIGTPAKGAAAFGIYFNDGTGAKMDYYMRRSVQLLAKCTEGEFTEYVVRIVSTNTAPLDAGTSLPGHVTGAGIFGVPAGSVQTNITVYGPALSHIYNATEDGTEIGFGSHIHDGRPVGVVTSQLAPGESSVFEIAFIKILQQNEPTVTVTPTMQRASSVVLPTESLRCP